jgi:predicted metal-dependent phosphoesterase TrpH
MNPEFRADLHCHSICSDGSDSPLEILAKANLARLSGLSITDHDTIDAYSPEFFKTAQTMGIRIMPGVEFSSELRETTVHVLGYGFDIYSPILLAFIEEMQRRRNDRNLAILKKLETHKIIVSDEDLHLISQIGGMKKKSVGRPHIAAIMVKKGYVQSFQEAFDRYLKEGTSCYVPGFKFTPLDAIRAIHEAGGKAVLAHPHFIKNGSYVGSLLSLPFDGIECYYGNLPKHQEMPWVKIAKQKGWIATGGSDYHGTFKPHISLGCSWVGESTFQQLLAP